MKSFNQKVAVITGGASGLGRAFADKAASLKMRLVIADVDVNALAKAEQELKAVGAEVATLRCDVSNADDVQALADLAMARFGGVNLLFNNAGVGSGGLVWENTLNDWQWVLGVNLWGVIHGIRSFTPLMLSAAKADPAYEGHIVSVASVAGLLNPGLMGAYNVSKHGVVAISESLYHDLAGVQADDDQRVSASVLCPAFVATGIANSHRNRPAELSDSARPTKSMMDAQSMIGRAVAAGRLSPTDVAEITFKAIAERQFYIFTHKPFMSVVKQRFNDITTLQNPSREVGMGP